MKTNQERYNEYMRTYNGRQLTGSLDTVGLWHVKGEDPNCDLGGHHYQPEIGFFEGRLKDVIMLCVGKPNFWSWGGGGTFKLVSVIKTDEVSVKKMQELEREKQEIEKRLKEINNILK